MNNLLLDTSVIIDFLRIKNKKSSLFYQLETQKFNLYISVITHTELYAGKSVWDNKTAQKELEIVFSGLDIYQLDSEISKQAGLFKIKYGMDLIDAIIAATAIKYNLNLVTLNTKDFAKIKELNLYPDL